MNKIDRLIKNNYMLNKEKEKERIEAFTLLYENEKNNIDNQEIKEAYNIKNELEERITKEFGWEKTIDGFEKRKDFKYNEETHKLTFENNNIKIENGKIISDGKEETDEFIVDSGALLKVYIKNNEIINKYKDKYKEEIERELKRNKLRLEIRENRIGELIYNTNRHQSLYLQLFGEIGKKLLVKWLNKLNETEKPFNELCEEFPLDKLYEEFVKDINEANQLYETRLKNGTHSYVKFESVLLTELEIYNPRGKYLKTMHKNNIKNNKIKELKK